MGLEYIEKYDVANEATQSIFSKIKGYAIATTADVVSTLWNSLPLTPEVKTSEILEKIDADALAVYNENPETVQTLSFIGGVLVPGGVGLKLLNRAREGAASLGYMQGFVGSSFTGTRQKLLANEIEMAFKRSGAATAEYQALRRQLYAANATQQVIDNLVIEAAIIGAMNAHPFMEDYLQDPVKNFAIGAAVGGVLGAAFSIPLTNATLRGVTAGVERSAVSDVLSSGFKPVAPSITGAAKVQAHTANIESLTTIADDPARDIFVRELAVSIRTQEAAKRTEVIQAVFPKFDESTDEMKKIVLDLLNDPKFVGVDSIKLLSQDRFTRMGTREAIISDDVSEAFSMVAQNATKRGDVRVPAVVPKKLTTETPKGPEAITVYYRASDGATFMRQGAPNAAHAADIPNARKVISAIRTGNDKNTARVYTPYLNFHEDNIFRGMTSARQDLRYLTELAAINRLKAENIANVAVAADDLPRMHALLFGVFDKAKEAAGPQGLKFKLVQNDTVEKEKAKRAAEKAAREAEAAGKAAIKELTKAGLPAPTQAPRSVTTPPVLEKKPATPPKPETVALTELSTIYTKELHRQVNDLVSTGLFSLEEIAARTNLTRDGVMASIAHRDLDITKALPQDLHEALLNETRYKGISTDALNQYLGDANRLIAISGNPRRNPMGDALAALDRRQHAVAHMEMMDNFTESSRSAIGKAMKEVYSADVRPLLDKLSDDLHEIVNAVVGDPRIQSADNALRALSNAPVVTYLGKRIVDVSDRLKEELLTPIATALIAVRRDPAVLAEFNKIRNELAGLKGWRDIVEDEGGKGWIVVVRGEKNELIPAVTAEGKNIRIVQSATHAALQSTRELSAELRRMHNLVRTVKGMKPLEDLGFYLPPVSLVNKTVAYVIDKGTNGATKLLVANNAEELASLIASYKGQNAARIADGSLEVITKADQEAYNMAKGYTDYQAQVEYANVAFQHKGTSKLAIVPSDTRAIEDVLQSYEHMILQGTRNWAETYMYDTMYWLDELSHHYQKFTAEQPKRGLFKESTKNAALTVKNILLGRDQLEQSVGLRAANNFTDFAINKATSVLDKHLAFLARRGESTVDFIDKEGKVQKFTGATNTKEYYDALLTKLRQEGVEPMWKSFDEYLATQNQEIRNIAPAVVSAGNGMLATLQLRMLDVAHAAINMMSLPIMTWSALMERLPATAVGPGASMKFPLRVMYDGIRHMHSVEGRRLSELWAQEGFIDQAVRQYTELTTNLKRAYLGGSFTQKALDTLNGIQESKAVRLMASPSDWSERKVREISMHTGFLAAKQAYPGISDRAATIAAVSFTDRAVGNYHAAQRPTLFQGTLGAALGLYQTYFVTLAQHVYRGLESRNFRQLASMMLAQTSLFGMASWPGYNLLSEQVVSRFNDQHVDLTTGTYRAFGDDAAELILYGLPSSLGAAFYTRGDISPRVPTAMGEIAVFNGVKEGWNAAVQIVTKAAQGIGQGTPIQSLFEALSLQSLNRPIARWSELITQSSVTSQGNTVTPVDEFWTVTGTFARLMGTRPMEEQVVRNAVHLNKLYETMDHERRQKVVSRIKTALRDGDLDDDLLDKVAQDYVRFGGSAKGWTAAMNEVMVKTEEGSRGDLLRKLEPDSPLRQMLGDFY